MKIILSRKGMDSRAGGIPSPILPDGTLLSLPIPDAASGTAYSKLRYKGQSYEEIIRQLHPSFDFNTMPTCHLDPDIYDPIEGRPSNWKPAFGQCDASARHLDNMGVGAGDLFLFYGMFRQTEYAPNGKLRYVRGTPILHIIYGYMTVGEVLTEETAIRERYSWHPHASHAEHTYNRLYLPTAYGTLTYDKRRILTKLGQQKRRIWELPGFFAEDGISISWQGEKHPTRCEDHAELESACRGQEFVVTAATPELEEKLEGWAESVIHPELKVQNINHFVIPDADGTIYCRKEHAIVKLDFDRCLTCPLAGGSIQGQGIECYYEDAVDDSYYDSRTNHRAELTRISALIDKGVVGKAAVRR